MLPDLHLQSFRGGLMFKSCEELSSFWCRRIDRVKRPVSINTCRLDREERRLAHAEKLSRLLHFNKKRCLDGEILRRWRGRRIRMSKSM